MSPWEQLPETRFTRVGEDRIAYQVLGEGPIDLVYLPSSQDCIDVIWEYPPYARFLHRLATFSRLITFDRRGAGASDAAQADGLAAWESWADDAGAVLDTIGSEQAALLGQSDGGPTAILFAATRPERTRALVLFNSSARFLRDDDYPFGLNQGDADATQEFLINAWGTSAMANFSPLLAKDPAYVRWLTKCQRLTHTPRDAAAYYRWVQHTDVRQVLPSVRSPTMILHRIGAPHVTLDQGRYLAEHIQDARFVPLEGTQSTFYEEPNDDVVEHIEEFLSGLSGTIEPDRALAAILYTDIVGSTERLSAMGDREWRNLLDTHDAVARTMVEQHRGKIVKTTGDGILATFDGPGRAILCALALRDAVQPLGLEIRAGLHTGEVEMRGSDIAGIAAHIAARVLEATPPGELLVSGAVPMLVAGSGFEFEDRGEHELKGVPGVWRLYAVES
jgi:class 3 adenylate cyclase